MGQIKLDVALWRLLKFVHLAIAAVIICASVIQVGLGLYISLCWLT